MTALLALAYGTALALPFYFTALVAAFFVITLLAFISQRTGLIAAAALTGIASVILLMIIAITGEVAIFGLLALIGVYLAIGAGISAIFGIINVLRTRVYVGRRGRELRESFVKTFTKVGNVIGSVNGGVVVVKDLDVRPHDNDASRRSRGIAQFFKLLGEQYGTYSNFSSAFNQTFEAAKYGAGNANGVDLGSIIENIQVDVGEDGVTFEIRFQLNDILESDFVKELFHRMLAIDTLDTYRSFGRAFFLVFKNETKSIAADFNGRELSSRIFTTVTLWPVELLHKVVGDFLWNIIQEVSAFIRAFGRRVITALLPRSFY